MTNKPTPQQIIKAKNELNETQNHLEKLGLIKLDKNGNCKSTELGEDLSTVLEFMNRKYVLIGVQNDKRY